MHGILPVSREGSCKMNNDPFQVFAHAVEISVWKRFGLKGLPDYLTPDQAKAAFELLDRLNRNEEKT